MKIWQNLLILRNVGRAQLTLKNEKYHDLEFAAHYKSTYNIDYTFFSFLQVCRKTKKGKVDSNKLQDLIHRYVWHFQTKENTVKNYQKMHEDVMKRI